MASRASHRAAATDRHRIGRGGERDGRVHGDRRAGAGRARGPAGRGAGGGGRAGAARGGGDRGRPVGGDHLLAAEHDAWCGSCSGFRRCWPATPWPTRSPAAPGSGAARTVVGEVPGDEPPRSRWLLIAAGGVSALVGIAMVLSASTRRRGEPGAGGRSAPCARPVAAVGWASGALTCTSVAAGVITGVQWAVVSQTGPSGGVGGRAGAAGVPGGGDGGAAARRLPRSSTGDGAARERSAAARGARR